MNLRQIKRRALYNMTRQTWDYVTSTPSKENPKMFYTRHIKPCKEYSPWCDDCNAVRFRKDMGRFPRSLAEFDEFQHFHQELDRL